MSLYTCHATNAGVMYFVYTSIAAKGYKSIDAFIIDNHRILRYLNLAQQCFLKCCDCCIDTESLLTNWSSGSSSHSPTMYIEHENETNMMVSYT